jgi:hypothetical protein
MRMQTYHHVIERKSMHRIVGLCPANFRSFHVQNFDAPVCISAETSFSICPNFTHSTGVEWPLRLIMQLCFPTAQLIFWHHLLLIIHGLICDQAPKKSHLNNGKQNVEVSVIAWWMKPLWNSTFHSATNFNCNRSSSGQIVWSNTKRKEKKTFKLSYQQFLSMHEC